MFKNLKIGSKMMLLAGSILCLLLVVLVLGISGLSTTVSNGKLMADGNHLRAELLAREVDHLNWIQKVSTFLTDDNVTELDVQMDHTQCALGKWLSGEGRKHAELLVPELLKDIKAIEDPHKRLHESAQKIKAVFKSADPNLPQFLIAKELNHVAWVSAIQNGIITGDTKLDVEFNHKLCGLGKFLNSDRAQKAAAGNPELARIFKDIKAPHEALHKHGEMIAAFLAAGKQNEAEHYFATNIVPTLEKNRKLLRQAKKVASDALIGQKKARDIFTRETQKSLHDVQKLMHGMEKTISANIISDEQMIALAIQSRIAIIIVGVIALLLGLSFAYLISRSIKNPLKGIVSLIDTISQGDLSQDVPADMLTRKDEMGDMSQSLQTTLENLRSLVGEMIGGVSTLVNSSAELTSVSTQTFAGVSNMAERSNTLAAAAEEASSNTASVATGMDQTTQSLSSVASATEEMSATVGEIAANSDKARDISEQAMNQAQAVTQTMQGLGEAAQEIDKVTETITEISSQTNLLALNATIEAARAGAAGKGFAVVAGEIKELARQTAEATEDIKKRISGIQTSTGSAISDIDQINQIIQEVGSLVNSIAAGIEEQSVVTQDVAGNIAQASAEVNDANEQLAQTATVSQSIAEDVSGVNIAVDEIRQGNEQVQSSSKELSALAEQLDVMIKKFKVDA